MKAEDEIEELLAKNMHYHQPSFIAGFKKGKESQLQALKEELQSLHNDLSHVDESNWNEAVIDALGRLRKMKNLIDNLEDNE